MYIPSTPASSPLARFSSKSRYQSQLCQSSHSSPLSDSSSPTYNVQDRRRRQYKSQDSSRSSAHTPGLVSAFEDTPQKRFLRERFKAQCLERATRGRARAVKKGRESSSELGSSSDVDGDFPMDEGDEDVFNDEIYQRVMLNESRRLQHSKRVSLEQDFGSSIDPSMYEDMNTLERELTGKTSELRAPSPPMDDLDDALIQEYLAELEESERWEAQQTLAHVTAGTIDVETEEPGDLEREFTAGEAPEHPSPSRSMYSDFQMSTPPSSPCHEGFNPGVSVGPASTWNCPFCSSPTLRSHVACASCVTQFPLAHAHSAWFDTGLHPGMQDLIHAPLATKTPNESGFGAVMLCAAPECDWCFAL